MSTAYAKYTRQLQAPPLQNLWIYHRTIGSKVAATILNIPIALLVLHHRIKSVQAQWLVEHLNAGEF